MIVFGICMVYCGSPKKRGLETCKCCKRMKEAGGAY